MVTCMAAAGGRISSGGGFGAVSSPTPSWQYTAVQRYISGHRDLDSWPLNPDSNNQSSISADCEPYHVTPTLIRPCVYGRGFPDLALIGTSVPTLVSGQVTDFAVSTPALTHPSPLLSTYTQSHLSYRLGSPD